MRWSLPFSLLATLLATSALATPLPGTDVTNVTDAADARSGTTPASGAVVVDASGKHGSYKTIQAGVNALSTSATGTQNLFIYPGTYAEQVTIPSRKGSLIVQGYTSDTSSYSGNQVTITHSLALSGAANDDATGTVRNEAKNTKFYNVNIKNTFGKAANNGQALALSANAANQGYYGVALYGYQDTLLAQTGTQVYAKSLISGAVDFIFGQHGQVWITGCQIESIGPGSITASGRASDSDNSWYVIDHSNIVANGASAGASYLGRPWADYARVTFQNTAMSNVVNSVGWDVWTKSDTNTDHVAFEEYGNSGAGSSGSRASFSKKLSAAVKIADVLGSSYASQFYIDESYL